MSRGSEPCSRRRSTAPYDLDCTAKQSGVTEAEESMVAPAWMRAATISTWSPAAAKSMGSCGMKGSFRSVLPRLIASLMVVSRRALTTGITPKAAAKWRSVITVPVRRLSHEPDFMFEETRRSASASRQSKRHLPSSVLGVQPYFVLKACRCFISCMVPVCQPVSAT